MCFFNPPKTLSLLLVHRRIIFMIFFIFLFLSVLSPFSSQKFPIPVENCGLFPAAPSWVSRANITNCGRIFLRYRFYMPKRKAVRKHEPEKETACASCALCPKKTYRNVLSCFRVITSRRTFLSFFVLHAIRRAALQKAKMARQGSLKTIAYKPPSPSRWWRSKWPGKLRNLNKFSNKRWREINKNTIWAVAWER